MPGEVIVLTNGRLSLSEWNQAIQAQGYLAHVVLADEQPDAGEGRWYARLEGETTPFVVREVPVTRFPAAGPAPDGAPWRYAFTAVDDNGTKMGVAIAAVIAYALATGGIVYEKEGGVFSDRTRMKMFADMYLAIATKQTDVFDKRYGYDKLPRLGPGEIHVRVWKD